MHKRFAKRLDQQGFASIAVAIILVIILSLVTVTFAQLIRREQNNALNKQLSTQAFYAAETGVNDMVSYLRTHNYQVTDNTSDCQRYMGANQPLEGKGTIDDTHKVYYTCVLLNKNPDSLVRQHVGSPSAENSNTNSWKIIGDTGGTANTVKVSWTSESNRTTPKPSLPASGQFPPRALWGNSPAVLRFSITPLSGYALSEGGLITHTYTSYFYPVGSGAGSGPTYSTTASNQGKIYAASCNGATCSMNISVGVPGPYLFQIVSIYDESTITITHDGSGAFNDSQATIDVTGKAQDVLRRIRVTVPLRPNIPLPSDAIEAKDVCKRIEVSSASGQTNYYNPDMSVADPGSPPDVDPDACYLGG